MKLISRRQLAFSLSSSEFDNLKGRSICGIGPIDSFAFEERDRRF